MATFLSLTGKAYFHSVTHSQLWKPQHTYVTRVIRNSHFDMNRAFKVLQGHPYWCQQKSGTGCCRNVQQCLPACKFVDFNHSTPVWRQLSEKGLRISRHNLHFTKLESLTYTSAVDSRPMGQCLLLSTQLLWKLNPLSLKLQEQKQSFSFSLQSVLLRCHCKFRCVSNFTMASHHGCLGDFVCRLQWIIILSESDKY